MLDERPLNFSFHITLRVDSIPVSQMSHAHQDPIVQSLSAASMPTPEAGPSRLAPPFSLQNDKPNPDPSTANMVGFSVKYHGTFLSVRLAEDETLTDLRAILFSMTDVPPESQKLLGMVKGKQPCDETQLGLISYAPAALRARRSPTQADKVTTDTAVAADQACKMTVQFTLLGTPEADRLKEQVIDNIGSSDQGDAVQDLDYVELTKAEQAAVEAHRDPKNLAKLEKTIRRFSDFPIINAPRPGKKLLVLDLDYCIADTKRLLDANSPASLAARPGLHELLRAVYPYYDICVWSQTSWRWLEIKLVELNMLGNPDYNISFVIDRTPMFKIQSKRGTHEVKALEFIWRRWPEMYGCHNTIHIDDLGRNFAMNPLNGLKIKAYRNSPNFDTEFVALRRYLLQLAHPSVTDFTKYEHMSNAWKQFQGPEV